LYRKTSGKEWSVCRELTIDGVESGPKVACTKKTPESNGVSRGRWQLIESSPDLKYLVQKKLRKAMECPEGDGRCWTPFRTSSSLYRKNSGVSRGSSQLMELSLDLK
jgi:hypothetical protein